VAVRVECSTVEQRWLICEQALDLLERMVPRYGQGKALEA
jgi:hypothetical protein